MTTAELIASLFTQEALHLKLTRDHAESHAPLGFWAEWRAQMDDYLLWAEASLRHRVSQWVYDPRSGLANERHHVALVGAGYYRMNIGDTQRTGQT